MLAIIKQLISEFLIPLIIALVWSIYNLYDLPKDKVSIKSAINIFGPTFFFASWLVAQVFRVRKQQKVEGGLKSIDENIKKTLIELDKKTQDLASYITGGDSACYISGAPQANNIINDPFVVHIGNHPIYEVHARIVDLQLLEKIKDNITLENLRATEEHIEVGNLIPGHGKSIRNPINLGDGETRSFNIFYTARNGSFTQLLRFRKSNGKWLYAMRVMREDKILHEHINEGFPRGDTEEIDWK
jgi:hypothetical protein